MNVEPGSNLFLNMEWILFALLFAIATLSCGKESNYFYEEVKNPDEAILRGEVFCCFTHNAITQLDCQSSAQGTRIGELIEDQTFSIGDSVDFSKMFIKSTSDEDIMHVWFEEDMCEKWSSHVGSTAKILVRQELKVVGVGQSYQYMRLLNVVETNERVYDF